MDEQGTKRREQEQLAEKFVEDKAKEQGSKRAEQVQLADLFPVRVTDGAQRTAKDTELAAEGQRLANKNEHDEKMGETPRQTENFNWRIDEKAHTAKPEFSTDNARLPESKEHEAELRAREENLRYEAETGSHARARHGPQVTEAQSVERIQTGIASDGELAPSRYSSTFFSDRDLLLARTEAEKTFLSVTGRASLSEGPKDSSDNSRRIKFTLNEVAGSGYEGIDSSRHRVSLAFPESQKEKRPFDIWQEVSDCGSQSQCKADVRWNAERETWYVHTVYPDLTKR